MHTYIRQYLLRKTESLKTQLTVAATRLDAWKFLELKTFNNPYRYKTSISVTKITIAVYNTVQILYTNLLILKCFCPQKFCSECSHGETRSRPARSFLKFIHILLGLAVPNSARDSSRKIPAPRKILVHNWYNCYIFLNSRRKFEYCAV